MATRKPQRSSIHAEAAFDPQLFADVDATEARVAKNDLLTSGSRGSAPARLPRARSLPRRVAALARALGPHRSASRRLASRC
jgi:hypothetical protein